jgi:predicted TIM-barrel fold metal-dependent hydrolase
MKLTYLFIPLSVSCTTTLSAPEHTPKVAFHQHLISPATAELIKQSPYDAAALLSHLDAAGIRRGVVLSMAYTYADPRKAVPQPDQRVREENEWTAAEIARSRGRLVGFCSVNPLREAALAEIDRCTRLPGMRGLKLHFGNSGVDLKDPEHAAKLAEVFAAANARRAPIVVHMRPRTVTAYGREDAQLFIDKLLPAAPNIVVQVAHLGGAGAFPKDVEQAMQVFVERSKLNDPKVRNVWFDLTTVAGPGATEGDGLAIATIIRDLGVERALFCTDLPVGGNLAPAEGWAQFRKIVPLTEAELRQIAANSPPYMRTR